MKLERKKFAKIVISSFMIVAIIFSIFITSRQSWGTLIQSMENNNFSEINAVQILQGSKFIGGSNEFHSKYIVTEFGSDLAIVDSNSNIHTYKLPSTFVLLYLSITFGWGIVALVLSVILLLIWTTWKNLSKIRDGYGRNLMLGLSSFLIGIFILALLCTVGILPYISVEVPLVSLNIMQNVLTILILYMCMSIYRIKDTVNCNRS
jgi:hypothetical protein